MRVALSKSGDLIYAPEALKNKHSVFYCPACKGSLQLKNGLQRTVHFAHLSVKDCVGFSEPETQEHIEGKEMIWIHLNRNGVRALLESYLPDLRQRPDIYLPDFNTVIEYQCSSLPKERMIERTKGYLDNGYKVCWVMGTHFRLGKKLTSFQKLFIHESKDRKLYYLHLNSQTKKLRVYTGFCTNTALSYKDISIDDPSTLEYYTAQIKIGKRRKKSIPYSLARIHQELERSRRRNSGQLSKILYEHGETIQSFPLECYIPLEGDWMIQSCIFSWKFLILKWVEERGALAEFTLADCLSFLSTQVARKIIVYHPLPLISNLTKHEHLLSYLQKLTTLGIICPVSNRGWILVQKARRYRMEEEKEFHLM